MWYLFVSRSSISTNVRIRLTLRLCDGGLQLVRSLQDEDLPDDGPVSLKKVFQFLHQVSMISSRMGVYWY
jgi:hypothetical protein